MMKLFKIAFLPLLAGILLLPAASRPVRAAGSAAVGAGAGDRKRDKKKKQEADTAAKATPTRNCSRTSGWRLSAAAG